MRYLFLFLPLLFAGLHEPQRVYLVPTLHGLHKVNNAYNYDSVVSVIRRINPDVIAVEIRPEDINADTSYLKQNYPFEMWMMRYWFTEKTIMGFDWLGKDIEGRPVPPNYWKEIAEIKKWEKALDADSIYTRETGVCDTFNKQRLPLLKSLSLKELLNSNDAELTNEFYSCLETQLKGSIHQRLLDFYELRNEKILANLKQIIKRNPGKTIVILTGDDHYAWLKDKLAHDAIFK